MPTVREFQIPVPVTVDEYRIAQLYMIAKMSEKESDNEDGDAVEVLRNEPFEDGERKGQYTHKIYHLAAKIPTWVAALFPKKALCLEEKSWNAYPHCLTIMSNPYFTKMRLIIESKFLDDREPRENALDLSPEELEARIVEPIDISLDPVDKYLPEEDPAKFVSKKANRGPFEQDWQKSVEPIMTAYKLITVDAPYWGFGPQVEKYVSKVFQRKVHTEANRKLVCWMDEWFGLTLDDVRKMEADTFAKLNKELEKKKKKLGMSDTVVPVNDPNSKVPKWGEF